MLKLVLILDNIRSTHNVGSILRSADGFGVCEVIMCGITPYPKISNDTRMQHLVNKITNAIHKTALGAETTVPISLQPTVEKAISAARKKHYKIVALEQADGSIPIQNYSTPDKIALVLGNEVTGILKETLTLCDDVVEIPMFGKKESLNVSVSAAVAMYAIRNNRLFG